MNRKAIQAAIDSLAATASKDAVPFGTVYVPSGRFSIDRPIFLDRSFIGIRGEGPASYLKTTNGHDAFVTGIKRRPSDGPPSADHFPDLFTAGPGGRPILDGSAIAGRGQRGGSGRRPTTTSGSRGALRRLCPRRIPEGDEADDRPEGLAGERQIQQALSGPGVPAGHDRGRSSAPGQPRLPRRQALSPVPHRGADHEFDQGTDRAVALCPIAATDALLSCTIQIDLDNATIAFWRDGVQQKLAFAQIGPGWKPRSGMHFAANEHHPFTLGANSNSVSGIADIWGSPTDLTFCGLKFSAAAVYKVGPDGSKQQRADGAPINDLNRYFTPTGDMIGLLPLTDRPERSRRIGSSPSRAAAGSPRRATG